MKMVNLWEVKSLKHVQVINDINELLELIKTGKATFFSFKEKYEVGTPATNLFEDLFEKRGVGVIYTTYEHPVVISNDSFMENYINRQFFMEHEKEIKEAYQYYYTNTDNDYVSIPSFVYSDELVDLLIKKGVENIQFYDVELSDEVKKKLQDNFIESTLESNGQRIKISTNKIIGNYTKKRLDEDNNLILSISELRSTDYSMVKYLDDGISIDIISMDIADDEENSYVIIKDAIEKLSESGKHFKICFIVDNRSVFKKVFNGERFDNIDIIIKNDLNDYKYEDYLAEEEKLDKLVEPIISANLSPLERYIAVYNLVKNFKPYKENPDQKEESRYLRYILDNEYMVCVGYAKLLQVLCEKVGIRVNEISLSVDISYDAVARGEEPLVQEKTVEAGGHARCMVSIDDDKYGVHGVYVADPTWDNELSENRLNHALMTFSKIGTGRRMIWFNPNEPILDINSMDDFKLQFDYLLKKEIANVRDRSYLNFYDYLTYDEQVKMESDSRYKELVTNKVIILTAYKNVIENILRPLSCEKALKEYDERAGNCKTFDDFNELITDLGNYLLSRVNQPISNETLIQASVNGTTVIKGLNEQQRQEEYERTRKNLYDRELISFPYQVEDASELGWKSR